MLIFILTIMETNELLNQARETFIKEFSQTPETVGFNTMSCWKDNVILTTSEEVLTAYKKCQSLIRKTINQFCIFMLLFAIGTWISLILFLSTAPEKFTTWIMIGTGGLVILCIINIKRKLQCNQWEALYLQKDSLLIFDGKKFHKPQPEPVNPHTAFF